MGPQPTEGDSHPRRQTLDPDYLSPTSTKRALGGGEGFFLLWSWASCVVLVSSSVGKNVSVAQRVCIHPSPPPNLFKLSLQKRLFLSPSCVPHRQSPSGDRMLSLTPLLKFKSCMGALRPTAQPDGERRMWGGAQSCCPRGPVCSRQERERPPTQVALGFCPEGLSVVPDEIDTRSLWASSFPLCSL